MPYIPPLIPGTIIHGYAQGLFRGVYSCKRLEIVALDYMVARTIPFGEPVFTSDYDWIHTVETAALLGRTDSCTCES